MRLWQQVMLSQVRDGAPDLTMRQTAILFTMTRALDTMGALKLVSRHRDELDKRNVLIRRTVEGALFVERFGDGIVARAHELPI